METKKKKNARQTALILIAIIAVITIIGVVRRCAADNESVVEHFSRPGGDTLAVAIEMSPLTYTFCNDTADGFDYEIIKAITEDHGVTAVFHPVDRLDNAFRGLYDGDYDLLVATIPATSRLREYFPLTDPVYLDRQVLVQRRDTAGNIAVTSQEQLRGDTVYIAEGSPVKARLENMVKELGDTVYVKTHPGYTSEHLAIMTARGEVRQAVVSRSVARSIASDYPNLDYSTPITLTQYQVWAVAPGDSTLLDSINCWLNAFKATPQYGRLVNSFLGD